VAADMPEQIPLEVKAARNSRLLETANRVAAERSRRLQGRTVDVLVDGQSRKSAEELSGRTRCNRVVNFQADPDVVLGDVVPVRITDVLPHSLRGTLASLPEDAACLSR
jgi:tRNA-2-methylthio-N6-dimethylallyladenosine synthase